MRQNYQVIGYVIEAHKVNDGEQIAPMVRIECEMSHNTESIVRGLVHEGYKTSIVEVRKPYGPTIKLSQPTYADRPVYEPVR